MTVTPPNPSPGDAAEMARLRRDVQRKDLLLRELNHRMKNTLAGVAAFLSVDPPALSEEGRQWLERIIQRINMIAQAHELFALAGGSVTLGNLTTRLRDALPLHGSTVEVELAVETPSIALEPAQAIPLAMALHELCSNAIMHGTGGGHGRVRVVGRRDNENLVIEVIDDGAGHHGLPRPPNQHPLGLQLVRGLVTTELGGKFSMDLRDEGGMIARITFPIRKGNEE